MSATGMTMAVSSVLLFTVVATIAILQTLMWLRARRALGRAAPPSAAGPGRRLYYFFSPRCAPCGRVTPMIEALATRHPNVFKVDIGAELELARAFGVIVTPTFMLVENGTVTRVIVGAVSERVLERLLCTKSSAATARVQSS